MHSGHIGVENVCEVSGWSSSQECYFLLGDNADVFVVGIHANRIFSTCAVHLSNQILYASPIRYNQLWFADYTGDVDYLGLGNALGEFLNKVVDGVHDNVLRAAQLYDFPVLHYGDPVAYRNRLIQVVGDKDDGLLDLFLERG